MNPAKNSIQVTEKQSCDYLLGGATVICLFQSETCDHSANLENKAFIYMEFKLQFAPHFYPPNYWKYTGKKANFPLS